VSYGNGDGTFGANADAFALGDVAVAGTPMLVGDFLGNGLKGLATATFNTPGFEVVPAVCRTTIPAPASVLPPGAPASTCSTAKVTLGPQMTMGVSSDGSSRAADLDGDKKADLVVAGGGGAFSYQLSNGDGTFQTAVTVQGNSSGAVIAVGDVNADGKVDVVYAAADPMSGNRGIGVALNAGGGAFHAEQLTFLYNPTGAPEPTAIELVDANNDGHLDVIVDDRLALGHGDGTFTGLGIPTQLFRVGATSPGHARPYRFADLNGDLQLDALSLQSAGSNNGGFCASLNVGSGNFGPPDCSQATSQVDPVGLAVGDLNGDQKTDVVVANGNAAGGLQVFLGKGDGTFMAPQTSALPTADANQIELADFNNDGKLDLLVWFAASTQLAVLPGAGNGSFAATGSMFSAGSGSDVTLSTSVGDFGGNGLPGFAIVNAARVGFDVVLATCSP
jgi:hypothetical protein